MINSIKSILDKFDYKVNDEDKHLSEFFEENGYCIIPKSEFVNENLDELQKIIDELLEKESWRGGWEGKEEFMKYEKKFQPGAYRLGNLLNKHELFRDVIINEDILNICFQILGDDVKIGGLDMREPRKGTGQQDLHIDWIPKKNLEITENIIAMIFLDDSNEENGHLRVVPKTHKIKGKNL